MAGQKAAPQRLLVACKKDYVTNGLLPLACTDPSVVVEKMELSGRVR